MWYNENSPFQGSHSPGQSPVLGDYICTVLNISSHGNMKALTMYRKDFWSNNILKWTWIFNDGRPAQILALTVSIDVQFKASVKMENSRMIWSKKNNEKGLLFLEYNYFTLRNLRLLGVSGRVDSTVEYSKWCGQCCGAVRFLAATAFTVQYTRCVAASAPKKGGYVSATLHITYR